MILFPQGDLSGSHIIFIIIEQFMQTASCNTEQFYLHFSGRSRIRPPFDNILLARPRRLKHLIISAV